MNMKIRKTTEADFNRILEIYAYARDFMEKTGNPNQWGPTNWPPADLIHNDIKEWAYRQCGHLRVDTHTDNLVMQKLLGRLGFQKCGIIYVAEDHYPRYAYEKSDRTMM